MEVHKVVVGPYDNNVFVVRCRSTGEAVLIDAANEHERLLELCRTPRGAASARDPRPRDHIQAVPALREAGYEVAVTALDAPRLRAVGYDVFLDDAEVIEVGRVRLDAIHTPGHTPGSISFHVARHAAAVHRRHAVPRRPGQHVVRRRRLRHDHRVDHLGPVAVPRRHHRAARPRRRHHDRHRAPAPRRVDRPPLVTLPTRPEMISTSKIERFCTISRPRIDGFGN